MYFKKAQHCSFIPYINIVEGDFLLKAKSIGAPTPKCPLTHLTHFRALAINSIDLSGWKQVDSAAICPRISIRLVDTYKEYYDITLWTRLLAHGAQKGEALVIYVDTER